MDKNNIHLNDIKQQDSNKQDINILNQGLYHYLAPFKVYAYFLKQGIFILDAIFDTILYMPFRIIKNATKLLIKNNKRRLELYVDIVNLLLLLSVILIVTNLRFFELSLWFHNIRSQSQIKLYGIIQILELLDRSAFEQGDYILRRLYYGTVEKERNIFNRYLIYSFVYLFIHSCIVGLSFTVYTVIFSSGINLLYLAIFVLSLIKLKGSLFKKQDGVACTQMLVIDSSNFFQKLLHVFMIFSIIKFLPEDFFQKISFYFLVDIMVDSFKYTQIIYQNKLEINLFNKFSMELCDLSYALSLEKENEIIGKNLILVDQKNLNLVLQKIPHSSLKIMGKFQLQVFPYIVLLFYGFSYKIRRSTVNLSYLDVILLVILLYILSLVVKLTINFFQKQSNLYLKIRSELKKNKD